MEFVKNNAELVEVLNGDKNSVLSTEAMDSLKAKEAEASAKTTKHWCLTMFYASIKRYTQFEIMVAEAMKVLRGKEAKAARKKINALFRQYEALPMPEPTDTKIIKNCLTPMKVIREELLEVLSDSDIKIGRGAKKTAVKAEKKAEKDIPKADDMSKAEAEQLLAQLSRGKKAA